MCARKQTPDIMTEIMEGISSPPEPDPVTGVAAMPPTPQKRTVKKAATRAASKTVPKPDGPAIEKRVKYEYVLVSFQHHNGWRPRFIEGKEVANWMQGPLIHEFLEELGEDGWELAAASGGESLYGSADRHQLFFKRVK